MYLIICLGLTGLDQLAEEFVINMRVLTVSSIPKKSERDSFNQTEITAMLVLCQDRCVRVLDAASQLGCWGDCCLSFCVTFITVLSFQSSFFFCFFSHVVHELSPLRGNIRRIRQHVNQTARTRTRGLAVGGDCDPPTPFVTVRH